MFMLLICGQSLHILCGHCTKNIAQIKGGCKYVSAMNKNRRPLLAENSKE